ncbi:hypothetical protein ACFE04_031376 [Oxalis oulophora]
MVRLVEKHERIQDHHPAFNYTLAKIIAYTCSCVSPLVIYCLLFVNGRSLLHLDGHDSEDPKQSTADITAFVCCIHQLIALVYCTTNPCSLQIVELKTCLISNSNSTNLL